MLSCTYLLRDAMRSSPSQGAELPGVLERKLISLSILIDPWLMKAQSVELGLLQKLACAVMSGELGNHSKAISGSPSGIRQARPGGTIP